jgi:hypothetical protein
MRVGRRPLIHGRLVFGAVRFMRACHRRAGAPSRGTMVSLPTEFSGVTVHTKANVYFDGNVVSHTVLFADQSKKTLGLIRPGSYYFGTAAAERMEIVAGECTVTPKDSRESTTYGTGATFVVPANSGFTIAVKSGLCEYICSFLP